MFTNIVLWSCIAVFILSYGIFLYTVLSAPSPTARIFNKHNDPLEIDDLAKILDDLHYRKYVMIGTTTVALLALVGSMLATSNVPPASPVTLRIPTLIHEGRFLQASPHLSLILAIDVSYPHIIIPVPISIHSSNKHGLIAENCHC